jgi:hypothetical protein
MSGKHSDPIRGLMSAKASPLFQGRFGRLFRSLPAAKFGPNSEAVLTKLGQAITNDFDAPKDGKDDEESGIPALYTYFGQFIDHDITFDPASSLQKQDDPDALTDYRSPALDMDNVYGRGPDDQPYMYDATGKSFLLGNPITGGDPGSRDLARNSDSPARALIGDPRNDENSIVSQLQGLVQRFHNRTVADNPNMEFSDIQQLVRFHYQYVVVNDFLSRIIHSEVLEQLKTGGKYDRGKLKFFHWKNEPFMPVEFSVAAYRLGHSMIRPGYRLNDNVLKPIFPVPSQGLNEGLTGFRAMIPDWAIDWGRFIDIDTRVYDGTDADNKKRLQFAYRIDTSVVNPLSMLPVIVAAPPASLPVRNLLRGFRLGLPSGQDVARAMNLKPLADKDILIGQGVDKPDAPLKDVTSVDPDFKVFKDNCPLWTYVLAEAMVHQTPVKIPVQENATTGPNNVVVTTPQLGPVGGRIVAEVMLGLLFGDNNSYLSLDPSWTPKAGAGYKLKDFISYALGR